MGTRASFGFTIIETVLFLGITGLLIIGVLVGVGANVNVQRYRDAAQSFANNIQAQFTAVTNVQNGRSAQYTCNSAAGVVSSPSGEQPGASDCFIVGRYVRIQQDKIDSYTVLATDNGSTPTDNTDITALKQKYSLNVSQAEVESQTMDWGTEIARPIVSGVTAGRTPRSFGLLIIRSPESGQIYTFGTATVPSDSDMQTLSTSAPAPFLGNMIVAGTATPGEGQSEQVLCVESGGLFTPGQQSAVYISPYASSSSAVELDSNATLQQKGLTVSC